MFKVSSIQLDPNNQMTIVTLTKGNSMGAPIGISVSGVTIPGLADLKTSEADDAAVAEVAKLLREAATSLKGRKGTSAGADG